MAMPSCLRLLTHWMRVALALAVERAGRSKPARIAMMAITTSNSINVNAVFGTRDGITPDRHRGIEIGLSQEFLARADSIAPQRERSGPSGEPQIRRR